MCRHPPSPKRPLPAAPPGDRVPDPDVARRPAAATRHPAVTLAELRSHNTPSSAWASVHGRVLDITEFGRRHPGGDIIFLAAGKDATALVETYHPRGVPEKLLERLQIGVMAEGALPASFYSWHSPFYRVLKRRVLARLEEKQLARRGSYEIWVKALLILLGFWGSLARMYAADSFRAAAGWSALMGLMAHFVGTCIQHDGNHGAFATAPLLNTLAGATMDMIGASAFTWEIQHMLGHHPYTNVLDSHGERRREAGEAEEDADRYLSTVDQESDPDVFSSFPLLRMHPVHAPAWYHRYQHLYAPLLFALMTLAKVCQQDFEVARRRRLYHIDASCRYAVPFNTFRFYAMKILSTCYMVALPIWFHGWRDGTLLFLIGHCVCGESLATMFIVNHVIEGVAFVQKNDAPNPVGYVGKPFTAAGTTPMDRTSADAAELSTAHAPAPVPPNDWAAVQCQTSVNWSPGSWFWNHVSGGLCHQIEHHLFPGLVHTSYVHVQDVVEATCREYGVPYRAEAGLGTAYVKMLRHLRALGREKAA